MEINFRDDVQLLAQARIVRVFNQQFTVRVGRGRLGPLGAPLLGLLLYLVALVAAGGGHLDNVSEELLADFEGAGKASATLEVTDTDLAIRKAFTDDPVAPGGTVTLEFTILHDEDAPGDATGIAFTDDLAAGLPGLAAVGLPAIANALVSRRGRRLPPPRRGRSRRHRAAGRRRSSS